MLQGSTLASAHSMILNGPRAWCPKRLRSTSRVSVVQMGNKRINLNSFFFCYCSLRSRRRRSAVVAAHDAQRLGSDHENGNHVRRGGTRRRSIHGQRHRVKIVWPRPSLCEARLVHIGQPQHETKKNTLLRLTQATKKKHTRNIFQTFFFCVSQIDMRFAFRNAIYRRICVFRFGFSSLHI